jgi:hypothetical protein
MTFEGSPAVTFAGFEDTGVFAVAAVMPGPKKLKAKLNTQRKLLGSGFCFCFCFEKIILRRYTYGIATNNDF